MQNSPEIVSPCRRRRSREGLVLFLKAESKLEMLSACSLRGDPGDLSCYVDIYFAKLLEDAL